MLSQIGNSIIKQIVLVNEDSDECKSFQNALETFNIAHSLIIIRDRGTLLNLLNDPHFVPDFIFLSMEGRGRSDMHRLGLIKRTIEICSIPVVVYSKFTKPGSRDYCYQTRACEYFVRALSFLL